MNIHQSAMPVLIVVIPLLTAFVLPLIELWRRSLVFPLALSALAVSFGSSILVASIRRCA